MRSKDIGFFPHLLLYALSVIYGLVVRLRFFLYKAGVFKTKKLPCPVISVGNITVGGTGKTPVAIFIAELLSAKGKRVVILSRGYGRRAKGIAVVSDGINVLLDPGRAGDEPRLMAERGKGIPVVVGACRYKAGLFIVDKFAPDVIILDDGFQHIALERNVNILLIASRDGLGNGYLIPRGVLREPAEGAGRADIVLIKGKGVIPYDMDASQHKKPPVFNFTYKPQCLVDLKSGKKTPLELIRGKDVVAVSGIAAPESFAATLKELDARITKSLTYPDHHDYAENDLRDIAAVCGPNGLIVTTEKDGVKLKRFAAKDIPLYTLAVSVSMDDATGFEKTLARLLPGGF
ncbi:MAG: tetraacyldisaccharide 4'-kinase [Deltaproteobacteria bacterium]|nr:tetraacyldisaccharide 4'-kinase [Deltaproteobacteria bacterium]